MMTMHRRALLGSFVLAAAALPLSAFAASSSLISSAKDGIKTQAENRAKEQAKEEVKSKVQEKIQGNSSTTEILQPSNSSKTSGAVKSAQQAKGNYDDAREKYESAKTIKKALK